MSKIGDKVVAAAMADIGCAEDPPRSNMTKFGVWYGANGVPWCMEAVQCWCATAGYPLPYRTASVSLLHSWYKRNKPRCIVTAPEPGDIIIYNGHTGILREHDDLRVWAIEGNTSLWFMENDEVMERIRYKDEILAYIRPWIDEKEDEDVLDITKISDEQMGELALAITRKLSDAEVYNLVQRAAAYAGQLPAPEWARKEYSEALGAGVTDGSRPMAPVTRLEAALMALRVKKK